IIIEVASARSEQYADNSRKPQIAEGTLYEDLARRDFTVNALAMSLNRDTLYELTDHFQGLHDLDAGTIRTPLDPVTTFSEDPLRMLRAIRFSSQLGFKIEDETFRAIGKVKERMTIISQERITEELIKILKVPHKPSRAFFLMKKCGLLEIILPEIDNLEGVDQKNGHHHKDVFGHSLQVLDNIAEHTNKFELRFTALVHDIAKPRTKRYVENKGWTFYGHEEIGARMVETLGRRLKMSRKVMDYAAKLTRLHLRPIAIADEGVTDSAVRRLCVEAGDEIDDLITLCRADITSKNPRKVMEYMANFDRVVRKIAEVEEKDRLRAFQSPVRGDEIMRIFQLEPGPAVGHIKKAIEEAILSGEIENNYEAAFQYLESHRDRLLSEIRK
ncbi:MAG: HD domain-containing protein, partial [Candidatus Marinimicrobia bacterium]|nr:HD domain-containing protein [Candidatus Neomarinimicrobiota bacterium]